MSSTVEKIKERVDIVDVVGSYIKLEKAGSNFKARCPFHNERTPSFFVSPARGSYYCFGCGAKGDIFTFVEEFEGLDFMGALRLLADRGGVVIEAENREKRTEEDRLHQVLESAALFFEDNLNHSDEAMEYLIKRGINKNTVSEWRLGLANDEWRELRNFLRGKGYSDKDLFEVGLIKKVEDGVAKEPYDVFRGRIMFPIFDGNGRIVGFTGRIFPDKKDAPKYLNTPETALFHKSDALYGIHKARGAVRKLDYTLLVEGQMDLLASHQAGFTNSVATSGTAFTTGHLNRLAKLSNRILMAFDSDKAGFLAAKKSAELALSLGMEVKIADLPRGSDPAELIKEDVSGWKEVLKSAKHLIDFYLDHLLTDTKNARNLAKEVEKRILPYVAMLRSAIEQSHFVSQIAKKTGIREEAVWNDLKNTSPPSMDKREEKETPLPEKEELKRRNFIERRIVGIIYWQESAKDGDIPPAEILGAIDAVSGKGYGESLVEAFLKDKDELIFEAEAHYDTPGKLRGDLDELLENFEEDFLREKFVETMKELGRAESEKDEKKITQLLGVCQGISAKLAEISKRKIKEVDK